MGEERVMFGTDYPFPLGEQDMGALIRSATSISPDEQSKILGLNAKSFFLAP